MTEAERQPMAERRDFILAAGTDRFVHSHAIAILEGSDSLVTWSPEPASAASSFQPQVGMNIGRYRVGTLLGSGATGSVYAGFDQDLNRAVAIKFFPSGSRDRAGVHSRSMREARAASALNHPNIIMIHEVIETGDTAAIVMELVSGMTLRTLAARNPPLSEVLAASAQLAGALAVAHGNGLVHGDIKPENVMVRDDGYVKLLDFGLAAARSESGADRNRYLTGTPRYLSPEQCVGEPATRASDMFSFGVMLYELAAGQHPFQSTELLVLLREIVSVDPPSPVSFNPKLPRALNALIVRLLSRRSQDRPTAVETAEQLERIRAGLKARGRVPGTKIAVFAFATAALAGTALLLIPRQQRRPSVDLSRMNVHPMASQPGLETKPSLSPDGAWISCLYRPRSADRPELQVHSTRGGVPTVLNTGDLEVEESAAWSSDSRELAFVGRDRFGNRAIYRMGRTGQTISKLADCFSDTGCSFDWAPDGHSLAVTELPPGKKTNSLFLVDLAGGRRRRTLLRPEQLIFAPRFSPDGKWISFVRMTSYTGWDLCMVPSSGGPVHCATRQSGTLSGAAWNPDSQSLVALLGQQGGLPKLWQFPADGESRPGSSGCL